MPKRATHAILTTLVTAFAFIVGTATATAAELTVSAAVSLKPALEDLAKSYQTETNDELTFNFGASGALQQQIENGAPVDVFLSAASKQMDALAAKGLLLEGTRRELLRNELVLVVPNGAKGLESFEDLKRDTVKRIAVGEPKAVPAGQYAHEVFTSLKLADALAPKLIPAGNVRQVLTYVEGKDVDAGVVYASDARDSAQVTVVAKADPAWHSPIVYPVAVLRKSRHAAEAKRFAAWLGSKAAMQIFVKHGFQSGKDAS